MALKRTARAARQQQSSVLETELEACRMLRIAFCAICPVSAPEINRHDGYVTRLGEAGPISAVKIGRRHAKTLSRAQERSPGSNRGPRPLKHLRLRPQPQLPFRRLKSNEEARAFRIAHP